MNMDDEIREILAEEENKEIDRLIEASPPLKATVDLHQIVFQHLLALNLTEKGHYGDLTVERVDMVVRLFTMSGLVYLLPRSPAGIHFADFLLAPKCADSHDNSYNPPVAFLTSTEVSMNGAIEGDHDENDHELNPELIASLMLWPAIVEAAKNSGILLELVGIH